jgi:hypothetical protein
VPAIAAGLASVQVDGIAGLDVPACLYQGSVDLLSGTLFRGVDVDKG